MDKLNQLETLLLKTAKLTDQIISNNSQLPANIKRDLQGQCVNLLNNSYQLTKNVTEIGVN